MHRDASFLRDGALLVEALEQRTLLEGSPLPTIAMLSDSDDTVVRMETRYGDIDIELFDGDAPIGVGSVLGLLRSGAYAGTFFHNVEPGTRLRGGLYSFNDDDGLSQRTGFVDVDDASGHANTEMTVSLPVDNSGPTPRSSGELVFNLADNSAATALLVIGRVVQGWSVVMQIAGLPLADLSALFPGNPAATALTSVPVTSNTPPPTSVSEDLLTSAGDMQVIKPGGVGEFYTERLYFPDGYSWERTFEAIELLNPGAGASNYQILVRYERGVRDQVVSTGAVAAERRATVVIAPGFGQPSEIVRNNEPYAYEVWSTTPLVAGFRHKDFKAGVGETFFRPASLADQSAMREWSFFQSALGFNSSQVFIVWQNVTGTDATVTVDLFFENSAPIQQAFTLEAHRRGGVDLLDVPGIPPGAEFIGARVTSDQNIVASLTRYDQRASGNNGDEGGIAALGLPGGGAVNGAAPGARRGGEDPVAILNTGAADAHVTFLVMEEASSGTVLRTAIVPAGRVLVLEGNASPASAVQPGRFFNIRYSSDVPVTIGFVTSAFRGTGTGAATTAARMTHFADARSFTAPRGAPFGQQSVSIFNAGTSAAAVSLVFRFDDHAPFTTASFVVTPGQATHRRINSFASELAQFLGGLGGLQQRPYSISVVSDVPVVAQSSQLNADGRTELGMTFAVWEPVPPPLP